MPHEPVTLDDLVEQLRSRGRRATTARRAVLGELLDAGDTHLTADELARGIQARHPAIHLSTIYRTLDSLADAELISLARLGDQAATYHLTTDVHHHALCTECGATLSFSPSMLEPVRRGLLRDYGFHANPQHLTIAGHCSSCAGSRDEPSDLTAIGTAG